MRVATKIELSPQEYAMLERVARSEKTSVRLARRAKIVLLAAQGKENIEIASTLGVGRVQVGRCRERYAKQGFAGIEAICPVAGASA